MTKNILIIGNGFDIAHGLPTTYTDFVDFLDDINYKESKAYNCLVNKTGEIGKDYFDKTRKNALLILGKGNLLFKYICNKRTDHVKLGDDWVDFEHEIAIIIKHLENKIIKKTDEDELSKDTWSDLEIDFSGIIEPKQLHEEFYRLLCSFEYYIYEVVNKIHISEYSDDIKEIKPDVVISLNYSDTFERCYSKFANIVYIHGKAKIDWTDNLLSIILNETIDDSNKNVYRDNNHIVLGIDEYLSKEQVRKCTQYIGFRKYFQRVTKKTGNSYKELFDGEFLNVYFYGHSLDPTDGELIRSAIDHKNAKTIIYYHNEDAYIKEITNLIRIFGKDFIINRCGGESPSIVFKNQRKLKKLDGDQEYNFYRAKEFLENIKKINNKEFEKCFSDFIFSVTSGRGIATQQELIDAYYLLIKLGLQSGYKNVMLNIAKTKIARDDNGNMVNARIFDPQTWAKESVEGHLYTHTELCSFINSINENNEKIIQEQGDFVLREDEDYIDLYEKGIPSNIERDDYYTFLIRMITRLKDYHDPERIWKLLRQVTISIGNSIAREVLRDFKNKNMKEEYKIVVANTLLKYLDEYEEEFKKYSI